MNEGNLAVSKGAAIFCHVRGLLVVRESWSIRAPVFPELRIGGLGCTLGALIIRIGFWGPIYCNYVRNHKKSVGNYLSPYISMWGLGSRNPIGFVFGFRL